MGDDAPFVGAGPQRKLSPKIRRALLLNILPHALQSRLLEHLDRLLDYKQVREKIASLVQSQRNPDPMDCSLLDGGSQPVQSEDEAIEAEGYTEEEEAMDLAALADVVCCRCQKKGHFVRNCKMPPPRGQEENRRARRVARLAMSGKNVGGPTQKRSLPSS